MVTAGNSIEFGSGAQANRYSWQKEDYTNTITMTPSAFLAYVKTNKKIVNSNLTSLNEITSDGIYIANRDLIFSSGGFPATILNYDVVIIAPSNTVTINVNLVPNSGHSWAIIANAMNFNSESTSAEGIFIANSVTINDATDANGGLKIKGNLVAGSLTNSRDRTDNSKPTLFVVLDPTKYVDLLPYLSTGSYKWDLIQ
jgi:hypothetical protein